MCLKKSLALLVLLLLLLQPLYSEVKLTDEEYQAVTESLTTSEIALKKQEESIRSLEAQLQQLKALQEISSEIIKTQQAGSEQLKTSLKEQKKDQTLKQIERFIQGASAGVLLYFIIN